MIFNIEQLKKKIIYRSNYRGTKEMDKLLGAFTKKYIDELSNEDLADLKKLLDIDDTNLYNFFNGLTTDFKFTDNKINFMFKNFKYSGEK
jgi:antitoxin CptB